MRLKKLIIGGFKSFADRTILHFDPGVTCIVGPNGCGKSNIADAFRWVLGEQSAKSMRGQKMPDIIFAGTHQRKPLDVAEVSMTLTDVQGLLPITDDEVTITRRLHRNGNSEYLINGHIVRLKDLQNLFLDSGIGGQAFSIFEQGKIERVIHYTPHERRSIFEESAGILRFLQRKREALKRLEESDLNLSRVKDIQYEEEKRIRLLEEQARKAKQYKENQATLKQLEQSSYILRWNQLEEKWLAIESRQQTLKEGLHPLQTALQEQAAQSQQMKALLEKEENTLKIKEEAYFKLSSSQEIQQRERLNCQQRLKEIDQREKKLKQEIESLTVAREIRQNEIAEIQRKLKRLEGEFHTAENQLSSQKDKVHSQEKELNELNQSLQKMQQQQVTLLQQESQLASQRKQGEVRLENSHERKKQGLERQIKLKQDLQHFTQLQQEKTEHLQQLSSLIDSYKARLERYEAELRKMAEEIENKQKENVSLQKRLMEQKARHQILIRMRNDLEGFSSGSKKILQESSSSKSPLYQKAVPLYTYLSGANAEVLSVILHHYAHTLIVEKEEDFLLILNFAEKQELQDYSLLCLESLPKQEKGSFLASLFLEKAENAVSQHLLQGVAEADDYAEALKLLKTNVWQGIWCQQRSFFDQRGVFFHVRKQENHIFLREAELKGLEEELREKEEQLRQIAQQLHQLQQSKNQMQGERTELDKGLRRDEMKLVEVNFGLQRALADQNKTSAELLQLEKELTQLEQQSAEQQKVLGEIQAKHEEAREVLIQLQEQLQFIGAERDKRTQVLRMQQQDQKEKGRVYHQLSESYRQLVHQQNLLEVKEQDQQQQQVRLAKELKEIGEALLQFQKQEQEAQKELIKLEKQLQEADQEKRQQSEAIKAYKSSLEKVEKTIAEQQERLKRLQEELNQLSIQSAQHRSAAQSLEYELQERYQMALQEAKESLIKDQPLDQVEKQIRTFRQLLQAAGDVNLAAIEELSEHQAHYAYLTEQISDLADSKQDLLQIIAELDKESRNRFQQTFEAIRMNFKKNFQILFQGGEADLQFTDTDDILEAGIEIIAKPPGKHMRAISLLSGGEKCLTAVALLFAIFEVKPAPFCILDEIDAPLDDTNVERFTHVVEHFVDRCQFLIITHNKRTMAVGDVLFGVSMEEKGVSKLLSLQFSQTSTPEAVLV